jgi:hypothetical protein
MRAQCVNSKHNVYYVCNSSVFVGSLNKEHHFLLNFMINHIYWQIMNKFVINVDSSIFPSFVQLKIHRYKLKT